MSASVTMQIFEAMQFFIYQYVISLEQRLRLNISIEYIYIPYNPVRPGFPGDNIYRVQYCRFFMVHQKDKPGRKQVFGPGNGHNCFVDSPDIGHRHRAGNLRYSLELAAPAIFACTWPAYLFLCTKNHPAGI
jgi:hypothetical protein